MYEYGTQVTVEAFPTAGYSFVEWSDGSTDNPYTFTVQGDVSLVASFTGVGIEDPNAHEVTIKVINNHIYVEGADNESALLYDVSGRLVAASKDASEGFEVSSSGIYLLRIGNRYVKKVAVNF